MMRSALSAMVTVFLLGRAAGQEPFLSYEFEDKDELEDFFAPPRVIGCGANIAMGSAAVQDGELVMENGSGGGSILMLLPEVVDDLFPDSRNYRLRMRVNFETHSGNFYVFVRTRMGVDMASNAADITDELGYPVYLSAAVPEFGVLEESACNVAVAHPEWPGNGTWALGFPGFTVATGDDWYWMEIEVSGDDDGGPVALSAKSWPDEEEPPESPQFELEDVDGLLHTDTTRDSSREVQILFLNLFGGAGQRVRVDDVSLVDPDERTEARRFVRGDCNGDGSTTGVTDAVYLLGFNFLGGKAPPCRAACDANGDGRLGGVTDAVYLLGFNFLGGAAPRPPFPACGIGDLSTDGPLGCERSSRTCE